MKNAEKIPCKWRSMVSWSPPTYKDKGHNRHKSEYGWSVWHLKNLTLGKNTDIGYGTLLFAHKGIEIEDEVQIGAYCIVYSFNTENETEGKVILKRGCKIGARSIIFPGVIVKEKECVKAGSVIWKDQLNRRMIKTLSNSKRMDYEM